MPLSGDEMKAEVESNPEVYSAGELARAGGFAVADIHALIASGGVRTLQPGDLVAHADAVRVLRALRAGRPVPNLGSPAPLFSARRCTPRETRVPLLTSSVVHAVILAVALGLPLLGGVQVTDALSSASTTPVRLVFIATPGPGGGGGGGGRHALRPPAAARRAGNRRIPSPLPTPAPQQRQAEPEPQQDVEPVRAPVASIPADAETRPGVIEEPPVDPSLGSGEGGVAGTGTGAGVGAGTGAGVGEGDGGGTGGGPFRPGSGIEPPSLLREVKPDYSEEARRQSIEGDVVLEIVVRQDGSVGDVRVLHGLGHGLDQRAIQAVRQWRFLPARRRGVAVDVLVEVAVEFKLR